MIFKHNDYIEILTEEFDKRKAHNKSYSMRAFSRDIGIVPSRLSEVLKGKQGLSGNKAQEISKNLNLNKMEEDFFISLVESKHARSKIARESAQIRLKKFNYTQNKKQTLDVFKVISQWEHLALLELIQLKGSKSDQVWISAKLGISEKKVTTAITRLKNLGLLEQKGEKLKRINDDYFEWPTEIPSSSIKNYHKGILTKAIQSLFTTPIHQREFRSLVMPIDTNKIKDAKKLMLKFNKEMNKLVSLKKSNNRVYYFCSQLFPADKE